MENKKYLDEETYQKNNDKVKKVGKILLIVGIVTLVISFIIIILGFTGFGSTVTNGMSSEMDSINDTQIVKGVFGSFGLFALGGFINSIGCALTVVGVVVMIFAHRREITAYTAQQIIPVKKEIVDEVAPTIGKAAGTIAKDITKGIKQGINEANNNKEDQE